MLVNMTDNMAFTYMHYTAAVQQWTKPARLHLPLQGDPRCWLSGRLPRLPRPVGGHVRLLQDAVSEQRIDRW